MGATHPATTLRVAEAVIAHLSSEGWARATVSDDDDVVVSIVSMLRGEASPAVTLLAFGQTRRSDGFRTESQYLASQRRPQPMRLRKVADRNSHRRWMPEVTTVREILENKNRGWQGNAACRRQAARAFAATAWYGVPNIILGA